MNVGSSSSPDYRLAVTSNNLGPDSIQLNDGTQNLLSTLSTGTDAKYKVNGSATDVHRAHRARWHCRQALRSTCSRKARARLRLLFHKTSAAFRARLSNVVSAYNAAFDALAQNRGQNGGALTGDPLVLTLSNVLQQISQYASSSGSVNSLADLGVTVSSTGDLAFDPTQMSSDQTAITQFLGGISSGGFLQAVNNDLTAVTDSTSGMVASDYNSLQTTITTDNAQIAEKQNQIATLQANLEQQLSLADAQIATLQAQNTYFQQLFTAEYGGTSGSGGTLSGA